MHTTFKLNAFRRWNIRGRTISAWMLCCGMICNVMLRAKLVLPTTQHSKTDLARTCCPAPDDGHQRRFSYFDPKRTSAI